MYRRKWTVSERVPRCEDDPDSETRRFRGAQKGFEERPVTGGDRVELALDQ
jgi:hypothetical protein